MPIWHHPPLFEIKFNCWIELKLVNLEEVRKVRNFPQCQCHFASQVHICGHKLNYMGPNTMQNESSLSTGFHDVTLHTAHFLEGVNLTGRIPLFEWVKLVAELGIVTTGPLVIEDWIAPVELTGMYTCPSGVALLANGCGTELSIGKAGSSSAGSIELKGWWECGRIIPVPFHSLPAASSKNKKVDSWLDHESCPSQYGIIRKLDPIWFRFLYWLVDHTSFPYISSCFLHKNRLSWFQFHCKMVRSTGLSANQLAWVFSLSTIFPPSFPKGSKK